MDRLRLGILQTNRDPTAIGTRFPDDAHRFRDLFDAQERRYSYRVYMSVGGEVPADPEEQDAWLVTGSPLSVLDGHDWLPPMLQFLRDVHGKGVPLFGACFGHQAIGLALGGTVETAGWHLGVGDVRFTDQREWMDPFHETLPLYCANKDQVTEAPPGFDVLGEMAGCPIACMSSGTTMGIQCHPELTDTFLHAVLDGMHGEVEAGVLRGARESMAREARGDVFAAWVTRFFETARNTERKAA